MEMLLFPLATMRLQQPAGEEGESSGASPPPPALPLSLFAGFFSPFRAANKPRRRKAKVD